jgi:large subunit ribosomal protein L7A
MKQTLSQIKQGNVTAVFIAKDVEESLAKKIISQCENTNIEIRYAESMKLLGKACAISRGAACAAILKKELKGGEISNAND